MTTICGHEEHVLVWALSTPTLTRNPRRQLALSAVSNHTKLAEITHTELRRRGLSCEVEPSYDNGRIVVRWYEDGNERDMVLTLKQLRPKLLAILQLPSDAPIVDVLIALEST